MAAPSVSWPRTYVMGQSITGRLEAPITPVNTTILTTTAGTNYTTTAQASQFTFAPSTTGAHGFRVDFTAARDVSASKYLGFQVAQQGFPFPNTPGNLSDTFANGGISFLPFDSAGNWSEYYIFGSEYTEYQLERGGWAPFRDVGNTGTLQVVLSQTRTPDANSGTMSWSALDGFEFAIRIATTSGSTPRLALGSIVAFDPPVFVDGEVANPLGFDFMRDTITSPNNAYHFPDIFKDPGANFVGGVGSIYEPRFEFSIGDGSTFTYFRDAGSTLAFYPTRQQGAAQGTETQPALLLDGLEQGITINQSATDDVVFDGTTIASQDIATGQWFLDVTGSTSGTCTFTNSQFYRCSRLTLGHATASGCIFDDVEQTIIDANTGLTGGTFRNLASTSQGLYTAAAAGDFSAITATFAASNSGYDLTIDPPGGGTWDFTGLTVESGHTLVIRNESATQAITVSIAAGISFTTSTAGGTVTVTQPVSTFTINSNVSALIRIYTSGTQTLLDSTTGTSLAFSHSGQTIDYEVDAQGYIKQRFTGITLSGTSSVAVNLVASREYTSGYSEVYGTDAGWSRAGNTATITNEMTGRNFFSLMMDAFRTETSLRNTDFNLEMDGTGSLFFVNDAEAVADSSIDNLIDCGVGYIDSSGATTAEWVGVNSVGDATGFTGEYQQIDGSGTTDAKATGPFQQTIKTFGDATHGNFDYRNHLVLKYQPNGFKQVRIDVLQTYGIASLEPTLYIVAMEPQAINAATGDPAISITITDHTAAPITVGGLLFDYEIVDNGTNSAEDILRELDYNLSLDATYQGKDPFNWPDPVVEEGSGYATQRGFVEGQDTTTTLHGFYVSRSSADHPDFSRFQANNGSYYTPATVAAISAPNLTAGRVQVYNNTAAGLGSWQAITAYTQGQRVLRTTGVGTELGAGVFFVCTTAGTTGATEPAWDVAAAENTTSDGTVVWTVYPVEFANTTITSGYSDSWTDGTYFTSGDTIRLRWVDEDDIEIEATGVATVEGTTSFLNTPVADSVYTSYSIDGSTVTEYSADFPNVEVDVNDPDNVFYLDRFYAWWKFNLTTADGIRNFFGGVTATNTSNILINNSVVDVLFDNTKSVSARQGDTIVIQRADGAYPQVTTTSGGGGLGFYYAGIGYSTSSGSGLDTTERNKLLGLRDFDPDTDTLEGSMTHAEAARLVLAEAAGQVSVSGNTVTFRDQADTKDRIVATTDANGQRTSVTVDGT